MTAPDGSKMRDVWSIVRHPAFWLPVLLAFGVNAYIHLMGFARLWIVADGWGYYVPLPAIFVYGDPNFVFLHRPDLVQDIIQYRWRDGIGWPGLSVHGSGYLDKFALGPAVLQLPFFLVALVISHFRYAVVNGFETTFQIANAISGGFYFGLGSFLIYRACRLRYDVMPSAVAVTTVILATNLLFYGSADGPYAHIYGFCILSGIVYLTVHRVESAETPSLPAFILFGFLIGLAIMVRPTNAVYALMFLVFARGTPLRPLIVGSACAFIASVVAASPQMALWYVTAGHLIYYSYGGEGFHFTSPELGNYLFSIRKGVFFWHPLYFLMIVALLLQLPRRRFEGCVALLIVLLGLYLGASWGDYTFGDSFGSRQSVELLPALTLPFAGSIASLTSTRSRWAAAGVAMALAVLNTVQLNGYISHTLPWNNNTPTTYAKFWATTLRLSAAGGTSEPAGR
jgi:hypothetical protein